MTTRGRGRGLAGDRGVSLAVWEDGLELDVFDEDPDTYVIFFY